MKKRHWYEDKFGDLSKFAKKPRERSAPAKTARPKRAAAKSRAKKPICFNRRVTLLSLLKRIPAVKTPMAKLFG